MAALAVRLAGIDGLRTFPSEDVLLIGHEFDMRRIDASRHTTAMIERHVVWNWTLDQSPRHTMRPQTATTRLEHSVSEIVNTTEPNPVVRRLSNSSPETSLLNDVELNRQSVRSRHEYLLRMAASPPRRPTAIIPTRPLAKPSHTTCILLCRCRSLKGPVICHTLDTSREHRVISLGLKP